MHAAPRGVMVAVALGPDDVAEHLSPGLDIAAVNDPGNCVVSGPADAVAELEDRLARRGCSHVGCAHRMRSTPVQWIPCYRSSSESSAG